MKCISLAAAIFVAAGCAASAESVEPLDASALDTLRCSEVLEAYDGDPPEHADIRQFMDKVYTVVMLSRLDEDVLATTKGRSLLETGKGFVKLETRHECRKAQWEDSDPLVVEVVPY